MKNLNPIVLFFFILLVGISCTYTPKKVLIREQIQKIITKANGTVGVAIKNLSTKDTLSFNNSQHYPMQSVYKFPLALAILNKVDKGELSLSNLITINKEELLANTWSPLRDTYPNGIIIPLSEIISYSVSQSDNNGCDILFRLVEGTKNVESYIHSLGVKNIAISSTEEEMHNDWNIQFTNWCQPSALINLLELSFQMDLLSKSSKDFLWKLMVDAPTGPKRLKGLLPSGTIVAHKTGSSGKDKNGITAAVNDIGIIKLPNGQNIAIAVFITNSTDSDELSESLIAAISRAVYYYYN